MNSEKRDFDKVAATWDENPNRLKMANDVSQAIRNQVPLAADTTVADFGCGTGLITLKLQPFVHSITGFDSSRGMLDVFDQKSAAFSNVSSRLIDIDNGDRLEGTYHVIVSNMTFHHIKEIKPVLERLHKALTPDGYLCVSDLDPDEGQFHPDKTGVFHFGFDREKLKKTFVDAGFVDVKDITAAEMVKPGADGQTRKFTLFLITGRKG
jgi:2-polyprenyl-3-methyl-5-hydroxy-6-metoxy-1,4-benzoquinol methylase